MTSSAVKELNPLMNFVQTKSKGNLQDDLGGNFTDAFSKASGQQNVAFQSANAVQGSTKVQVQNTDKRGLDNDNGSKVNAKEVKSQDVSADKKLQETGEELVEKVAEELGVTEEEVLAAMEALGLTMTDLLNADNMTQLVLAIEGEDMLSLMTDEGLYNSLQNILSMVSQATNQLQEELGITPEELAAMLEEATAKEELPKDKQELPAQDGVKEQIPEGEEDYTVTVERNGETVKVSVEVDGNSESKSEEVTSLKTQPAEEQQTSGKEEGSKKDGASHREHTQESTQGNLLLENLLNRSNAVKTDMAFENVMTQQNTEQTQNIMNQIMDYMRIQVRSDMTQMELQLNPASLGTVNINITSKAGVITAQFLTQNETVKAAIESQIVQLKNSFEEQGIKVESVEVAVANHSFERNLNGEGSRQQQSQDGRRKGTRRVNLNGQTLDEEPEPENEQPVLADGSTVNFTA
jgi:flagellar hook-length control protein FliK